MEDIERYEELDNIQSTLEVLLKEINSNDYIELFKGILDEVRTEKNELEDELDEQYGEEQRYQEKEYWDSQF